MADVGKYDGALVVEVAEDGRVVVHGDIDIAGGPILDAVLGEREQMGHLVIDLADVSFIDSSGLRSLLGASRRAQARGHSVLLRNPGPEVIRLLEITGTTGQFVIENGPA
jgi:anti-sigma B factor antagonist